MGDSGLAFIFQADSQHKPYNNRIHQLDMGWWPLDQWGIAHRLDFLGKVSGVRLRLITSPTDNDNTADPAGLYHQYLDAEVNNCLRTGPPAVAITSCPCVIFGHDDGIPPLLVQQPGQKEVDIRRTEHLPWAVILPEEPETPMDRHQADFEALTYGLRLGRDEPDLSYLPGKSSGLKSWHLWIEQLEDPELRGPHFYHTNVIGHLWLNRLSAAGYLRDMSTRYRSPIKEALNTGAFKYDSIVDILTQAFDGLEEALKTEKGTANRISLIRKAKSHEVEAQEQLAAIIEMMGS